MKMMKKTGNARDPGTPATGVSRGRAGRGYWIFSTIMLLLAFFFLVIYRHQQVVPYLGKQMAFLGAVAAGIVWWLGTFIYLLVRLRRWLLIQLGATAAIAGVFLLLFEYRDMDGDMIPRFAFRWSGGSEATVIEVEEKQAAVMKVDGDFHQNPSDFPQFQGPGRDCRISPLAFDTDWNSAPPEIIWSRPVGEGYSGFAIIGSRAFTVAQDPESPDREKFFCVNLYTGEEIWSTSFPGRYESGLGGIGPRATPASDGERVYFTGALGRVLCTDLEGTIQWEMEMTERFGASVPEWGFAGSPLLYKDLLILAPGAGGGNPAGMAALDKHSGATVWASGDKPVSWSSPAIRKVDGRDILVHMNRESVEVRNPEDGTIHLSMEFGKGFPQVAIPVIYGGSRLVSSAGYGVGSVMWSLSPPGEAEQNSTPSGSWQYRQEWRTPRLKSKFAPMVVLPDNRLLGLNDGILALMNLENGRRIYEGERYGHGQFLVIEDRFILLQSEEGALHLLEIAGETIESLGSMAVFEEKTWNPPALSGNLLLMRNHRSMALIQLPSAQTD
jgi:outer membrane protein assembly factor BamB